MSSSSSHEDSHPAHEDSVFHASQWLAGQGIATWDGRNTAFTERFVPSQALHEYFDYHRVVAILCDALPKGNDLSSIARRILYPKSEGPEASHSYLLVFLVLLEIDQAHRIQRFIYEAEFCDSRLPFRYNERFPGGVDFERFRLHQQRFCAPIFTIDMQIDFSLEDKEPILPFVEKEQLARGDHADVFRIKLHPEFDRLDPSARTSRPNEYVLKTFRGVESKRYFDNENTAYKKLRNSRDAIPNLTRYYGSYINGDEYNVVLEYADIGTWEQFMKQRKPPEDAGEIVALWTSLLELTEVLEQVHSACGWHLDVHPGNLLIKSNPFSYHYYSSPLSYEYYSSIKLADFDQSYFGSPAEVPGGSAVLPRDTAGTKEYDSPECYRRSNHEQDARLRIPQTTDVWSLGSVWSEAAMWMVEGWDGVQRYRTARLAEVNKLSMEPIPRFHNTVEMLECVKESQRSVGLDRNGEHRMSIEVRSDLLKDVLQQDCHLRITSYELNRRVQEVLKFSPKHWRLEARVQQEEDRELSRVQSRVSAGVHDDEEYSIEEEDHGDAVASSRPELYTDDKDELLDSDQDDGDDTSSLPSVESYQDSIFSQADSQSSASSIDHMVSEATDLFVDLALKDAELFLLFNEALRSIASEKFIRNQRRLLKGFYIDLRSIARNTIQEQSIKLLQGRRSRETIARRLYGSLATMGNFEELRSKEQDQSKVNLVARMLELTTDTTSSEKIVANNIIAWNDASAMNESDSSNESDDEARESEDEEKGSLTERKIIFERTKEFLFSGDAFRSYKQSVRRFVQPYSPRRFQALIAEGNVRRVQELLEDEFETVARGDFAWLSDLIQVGYGYAEIAELLVDVEADDPWLYFEPSNDCEFEMLPGLHSENCIHHATPRFEELFKSKPTSRISVLQGSTRETQEQDYTKRLLAELCGLAGVIPTSRSSSGWKPEVTFYESEGLRTAQVLYPFNSQEPEGILKLVTHIQLVGAKFRKAFGLLQSSFACCDSFTIFRWNRYGTADRSVELRRIEAKQILLLLSQIDAIEKGRNAQLGQLAVHAKAIVLEFADINVPQQPSNTIGSSDSLRFAIHWVSLAIQTLCLGLLSYGRGHIGKFSPFFLVDSLERIILAGTGEQLPLPSTIDAELVHLTCMGDMTKDPVLVFRSYSHDGVILGTDRYDVLATPEDLIDTWGPALLITDVANLREGKVFGIEIGGGVLKLTYGSTLVLHWQQLDWERQQDLASLSTRAFDVSLRTLIGIVEVNETCPLQREDREEALRQSCSPWLHILGTAPPRWEHSTKQIGFQGGQFTILTVGAEFEKKEGITAKDRVLRGLGSTCPQISLQDLEAFYGLQMSLCTGVARRVPLRLLLAAVLPAYVESHLPRPLGWTQAREELLTALRGPNFGDWLLSFQLEDVQLSIIRTLGNLLNYLRDTGIDSEGKLNIAWIRPGEDQLCFKIQCHKNTLWAKILEDTQHCATFACMTTECLENDVIKCRGLASGGWRNSSELLVTEVCRHFHGESKGRSLAPPPLMLSDQDAYWIGPTHSSLIAYTSIAGSQQVQPKLEVRNWMSAIPAKYHSRLRSIMVERRHERIRERGSIAGHTTSVTVCARSV